jgi:hypothetical protein
MSSEDPGEVREPTEEELRQALEEQIRRLRPADVMVQTAVTLLTLAARRLGLEGSEDEKDLAQAKEAIDGARALIPLLPSEVSKQLQEPLSHLQLVYAQEAGGEQANPPRGAGKRTPPEGQASEQAAPKIWTPGS